MATSKVFSPALQDGEKASRLKVLGPTKKTSHFLVAKSCPILCNLMDSSIPGSSVLCYLPEFAQIHVHWVSDAILPSHRLPPPSLIAFKLSQHQGLFQWVSSSHQIAKVLEFQLQPQSFQWIFRFDWLDLLIVQQTLKSLHQHHNSKASVLWCPALFRVQLSHLYMTTGRNHKFDYMDLSQQSDVFAF